MELGRENARYTKRGLVADGRQGALGTLVDPCDFFAVLVLESVDGEIADGNVA